MASRGASGRGGRRGRVVAVTGAAGTLGRMVVQSLAREGRCTRVVALVHEPRGTWPDGMSAPVHQHHVDLTEPTADARLADVLAREKVDTVVHGSFMQRPAGDADVAHELEVIGTLHVLSACAAAGVPHVVMLGSTMCYGAHPQNPAHLREDAPLRGAPGFAYIQDKVEAETEVARFVASHKAPRATVLRLCPMVGSTLSNLWSSYFRHPVAPTVMGFDPLIQMLHPADALRAIRLAVAERAAGAFNIVGRGVIPLSTATRLAGSVELPVMRALTGPVLASLRAAGATGVPPQFAPYLTYGFVADGERAAHALGFVPQYGPRETMLHLLGGGPAPHVEPAAPETHGGTHG
jgi:UDP-glucose 4-epimerase